MRRNREEWQAGQPWTHHDDDNDDNAAFVDNVILLLFVFFLTKFKGALKKIHLRGAQASRTRYSLD